MDNAGVYQTGTAAGAANAVSSRESLEVLRKRSSTGKQLIGMPVISLDDGERQGEIHDVVYNPTEGMLVGFVVRRGGGLFSSGEAFWLAPDQIHAVGEDAITLDSAAALMPAQGSVSEVEEQAGEPVLGKRLMTEGGKFLGNVDDVFIDRSTYRVVAYEVSGGVWQDMMHGQSAVPVDHVISIGTDVAIVPDFVQEHVEQTSGGLVAAVDSAKEKIGEARTNVAAAIEDKEADYVRGKLAGRTVTDDAGDVVVREGEIIGHDHIRRATAAGKMHALAAAAGQAQASELAGRAREGVTNAAATAKERAADLGDAAQDRQGAMLVGRTTGQAVLLENGQILVPDNHVITAADVETARNAGKLNALTAAVGAGAWDSAKERAGDAYENFQERRADAAAAAPPQQAPATSPVVVVVEQPVIVDTASDAPDARLRQAAAEEDDLIATRPAAPATPGDTTRS